MTTHSLQNSQKIILTASYILDDLRSLGYWCIAREFNASEHGSYADRCRWYIQAILHVQDESGSLVRLHQESMTATTK